MFQLQVFSATLNQMLVLFIFMALGFALNKKGILPSDSSATLSKLETYLFVPCLVFSVFYKYCTVENFKQKSVYILYGTAIMAVSLIIGIFLAKLFAKDGYQRKIYTYSFAVANFSFMGNAVVLGVFGEKILFDYMIFTLPLNLYVYSIGTASLIPNEKGGKFSIKAFVNPIFISLILGAICGLTAVPLPNFLTSAVSSAGACMSPLAMLLTGFVIGGYSLKKLASDKKVYLASAIRLIILPTIFMLILLALKTDNAIIRAALCATAMPLGLNTVVFPAAYGGDTTPGASMALISHLISIVTIPVMFAIFL
jgi:predicted permease